MASKDGIAARLCRWRLDIVDSYKQQEGIADVNLVYDGPPGGPGTELDAARTPADFLVVLFVAAALPSEDRRAAVLLRAERELRERGLGGVRIDMVSLLL